MSNRKREESKFHDLLRDPSLHRDPARLRFYTANKKFYAITRKSKRFFEDWLARRCSGRRVLDYGCGNGYHTILAARNGAEAIGIDISPVSVENAEREARRAGVTDRTTFLVMDGEALAFESNSFDIVCESGVLHHVDLNGAMSEIVRVLRPDGCMIGAEALGDNPIIQAYRRLTPHLRTQWEADHILRRGDILRLGEWFSRSEIHFFHLASLGAVPFRNSRTFDPVLSALETFDGWLMRLPGVRWLAWQAVVVLTGPVKPSLNNSG